MSEMLTQDNVKVGVKIRCVDKEGFIALDASNRRLHERYFSNGKVYEIRDVSCVNRIKDPQGYTVVDTGEFGFFEVVDEDVETCNTDEQPIGNTDEWTNKHYDFIYKLTDDDIKAGEINMEPYFVAKVWKTGSRDDSGVLIHQLKTIARFGDKNDIEREIKAMYNQAKAMARVYKVNVDE